VIAALLGVAFAAMPLPHYGEALSDARWYAADKVLSDGCRFDPESTAIACDEGVTELARSMAADYQRIVRADAGLTYLIALTHRYDGDNRQAVQQYQKALAIEPTYEPAWYDLGELWLIQGDYTEAAEAFEKVAELRSTGDAAWLGPWRRAEVAAHQHDANTFETWMRKALELGFSFRQIEGQPQWKTFYADPALRESVEKLITVYGTPDTLDTLK
jgi:tetratricopeptide (TPR) repeat protein